MRMKYSKLFGHNGGYDTDMALCPKCKFEYSHIERVYQRQGNDQWEGRAIEGVSVAAGDPTAQGQ